MFNPKANKGVISHDVIFDESAVWKWESNSTQGLNISEIIESIENQEDSRPQSTPRSNSRQGVSSISLSPSTRTSSDFETPPGKVRSLRKIYEACDVAFFVCEPQNFDKAVKEEVWIKAMNEEIKTIEKNNTWKLTNPPEGKEVIWLKWVYKTKYKEDNIIHKHKARLVAKGYSQQLGVDFNETFAPVARMETITTILALAVQLEKQVFQLDVKSSFLNGELEEEVYVEQPLGYVQKGKEDKVYCLQKALYGLKQAPRD